jgi:23S rRNA-/tRNA-specific pseudouridylate synthase
VGAPPARGVLEHTLSERPDGPDGERARGVVEDPRGKLARLRFERIVTSGSLAVLAVTLETGRKHQIRAQLAWAGYPLVGDPLYGAPDRTLRRPALHSAHLALEHPVQRTPLEIAAEPPGDLSRLLRDCGFDRTRGWGFSGPR